MVPDVVVPEPVPISSPRAEDVDVSRDVELRGALSGFERKVGDVRGAVVASRDGLPLASTFDDGVVDRFAAMAASVVGLSEEILADVERGTSVTIVRGDSGCLIVHPAGPDAVLAARTGPHPNVGLVGLELPAVVRGRVPEPRAMLTGDLSEFGAVDILGLLSTGGVSGALLVEGDGTAVVYCDDGDVTFATTKVGTSLADVLVATRFLPAETWAEAAATDDPAGAVAKALASKGADPARLDHVLQGRTEEAMFEISLWQAGSFRFEPGVDHLLGNAFRFPLPDLLAAVHRRRDEWDDLVGRFGSLDHVVAPAGGDDREEEDALLLSRTEVRVLTAAVRQVSVRTLTEELGLGLFGACEVVAGLLDRGLLTVGDVASASSTDWSTPNSGISFDRHVVAAIDDVDAAAPLNGTNGSAAGNSAVHGNGTVHGNGNGHANGNVHAGGQNERVAVAPNGATFVAPGDAPARDLILRLLTAVKEL